LSFNFWENDNYQNEVVKHHSPAFLMAISLG
jgi:hypothetical protein